MNEMNKENELLEKTLYNLDQALKDSIHPKLNIMLKEKRLELKHKTNISRYKMAMALKRINKYN